MRTKVLFNIRTVLLAMHQSRAHCDESGLNTTNCGLMQLLVRTAHYLQTWQCLTKPPTQTSHTECLQIYIFRNQIVKRKSNVDVNVWKEIK